VQLFLVWQSTTYSSYNSFAYGPHLFLFFFVFPHVHMYVHKYYTIPYNYRRSRSWRGRYTWKTKSTAVTYTLVLVIVPLGRRYQPLPVLVYSTITQRNTSQHYSQRPLFLQSPLDSRRRRGKATRQLAFASLQLKHNLSA
jgi:hypothetical protein